MLFGSIFLILSASIGISAAPNAPVPDTIRLSSASQAENISSKIEYRYRGYQFQHCKPETINSLNQLEWHLNAGNVLRVKRNSAGNWLRFKLANDGTDPLLRTLVLFWLNLPDAELCSVDSKGKYEAGFAGYDMDPLWGEFISPLPHFNIRLEPKEERTFYLYVLSNEDINYPIRLLSEDDYMLIVRLRSVLFLAVGFVLALAIGFNVFFYFRYKKVLFLTLLLHLTAVAATLYFLHGIEFASIAGNANNLFRHNYFLFLGITHVAFFLYMASWNKESNGLIYKSPLFWLVCFTGILYPLIPLYQFWYDHRILVLVLNYGFMLFYFGKTHVSSIRNNTIYEMFFITVWGIFLLLDLYKTIFHFDFYPYNRIAVYGVLYYLPALTVFVSLLSREILRKREEEVSSRKTHLSSLDISDFVKKIGALLEKEKIYLTKSLKEEHMAKELGINIHQLSELINTEFKTNFPSLINQYRVEEAKGLLKQFPDENTTEIGSRAGFSSRSAFYLEFKKITGTNPNSYRKENLQGRTAN
ncbi:helix-turn-helix domain-containing protein [Leptospira langatensis]|uniref:Helix-turn-helix domain-containing protein n=1 Tax=Leptospira langatensis TaxID=2484983 RepID=A0A5F2A0M9_9LEPT|nr:helix-turn-helix domain-containing protein [Leptospira langatensis]TGK04299.1 helix-turn-helix domain-containing protein [Leptospira langatensis]TGL43779.1 helix-turn-helix domain-containing protein [Leptospira langatensis]